MNYKKKALAIITTASLVSAFAVNNVEAKDNWEQRSVEDVKSEVQNLNDEFVYTIQYGDTLGVIAEAIDVEVDKLVEVNSIQNADLIIAGDELRISENKETVTVETETGDVSSYDISEEVVEVEPVTVETTQEVEEVEEVVYEEPKANTDDLGAGAGAGAGAEAEAKEWIGQRESGGDYNAYNPAGGYYGKYQLNPTLVAYGASPAEQEVAVQEYVNERYNGSFVQAKAHWQANGWY